MVQNSGLFDSLTTGFVGIQMYPIRLPSGRHLSMSAAALIFLPDPPNDETTKSACVPFFASVMSYAIWLPSGEMSEPISPPEAAESFVMRLGERTSREAELVRAIVRLGEGLQLTTVAEGIEDHHQFLALKRLGCELGQGYYFARPLPSDEIGPLLGQSLTDDLLAATSVALEPA